MAVSGNGAVLDEMKSVHRPVMMSEVLDVLQGMNFSKDLSTGFFLDATLGDGGHTEAILSAHKDIKLVGMDRDGTAIERARHRLARLADRCLFINAPFEDLSMELESFGIAEISGFLFDFGVSTNQIDDPARGFSFRQEGPLDMRMDQSQHLTAGEIVNNWNESELADLIFQYGDERHSRRIAKNIVASRPVSSTLGLAKIIEQAVPSRSAKTHPARRTFQALRIYVNGELDQIAPALRSAVASLSTGGRGVVIAYHSGEDRIAKRLFREMEEEGPNLIKQLGRKVKKPSKDEVLANPRSRSARMRSLTKLAFEPAGT